MFVLPVHLLKTFYDVKFKKAHWRDFDFNILFGESQAQVTVSNLILPDNSQEFFLTKSSDPCYWSFPFCPG